MKFHRRMWLPDDDTQFKKNIECNNLFAGKPNYQFHKFRSCFPWIVKFRRALDIGAHIGLWSNSMAHCFERLDAFEPFPGVIECWKANVDAKNAVLHEVALGAENKDTGFIVVPGKSGCNRVAEEGVPITVKTLDSFNFTDVDFIKIDTEGFEQFVLEGGKDTIQRCKPAMIIEQKYEDGRYDIKQFGASALLKEWGASWRFSIAGDHCFSWETNRTITIEWAPTFRLSI